MGNIFQGVTVATMRAILRKLYRHQNLNEAEYAELMGYADGLHTTSIESYQIFYERFAAILFQDYYTYLPRFAYGSDDFFDYLLNNPSLLATLQVHPLPTDVFPPYLQEYLRHTYGDGLVTANLLPRLNLLRADNGAGLALPQPRQQDLVCKYEEANPYKEIG